LLRTQTAVWALMARFPQDREFSAALCWADDGIGQRSAERYAAGSGGARRVAVAAGHDEVPDAAALWEGVAVLLKIPPRLMTDEQLIEAASHRVPIEHGVRPYPGRSNESLTEIVETRNNG
jgi:hypothetical protein